MARRRRYRVGWCQASLPMQPHPSPRLRSRVRMSQKNPYAPLLGIAGTVIGIIRRPAACPAAAGATGPGVSLDSAATSSVVSFGWATYGLLTGQLYVTLATGSSASSLP